MQFFYTPLEQFDEVTWLSHRVIETLEPYMLFITEIEFGANQLYVNSFGEASSSISFTSLSQSKSELVFLVILIGLLFHYMPVIASQLSNLSGEFAHLFFLLMINLATGAFVVI